MLVRHGLQFRWENRGYRDFADFLATFNHDKRKKVNQERQGCRRRCRIHPQGRKRDHARRLGLLLPLLREHLPRARFDPVPFPRVLRAHRRLARGQRVDGDRPSRQASGLRGTRPLRRRYPVGSLLGRHRIHSRPALRSLLLPGDRVLHRAPDRPLRGWRARRAQAARGLTPVRPGRRTRSPTPNSRARSPLSARANASTSRTPSTSWAPRARSSSEAIRRSEAWPRGCRSPHDGFCISLLESHSAFAPALHGPASGHGAHSPLTRPDERHRAACPRRGRRDADPQPSGRAQRARPRDGRCARRAHRGSRSRRHAARRRHPGRGKHFMAGGDIRTSPRISAKRPRCVARIWWMVERLHAAIETLHRMPHPVIGRVHGAVAGFGPR